MQCYFCCHLYFYGFFYNTDCFQQENNAPKFVSAVEALEENSLSIIVIVIVHLKSVQCGFISVLKNHLLLN